MQTFLENIDFQDQVVKKLHWDHCDFFVDTTGVPTIVHVVNKHNLNGCVNHSLSDGSDLYRSVLSGGLCHTGSHTEE